MVAVVYLTDKPELYHCYYELSRDCSISCIRNSGRSCRSCVKFIVVIYLSL